MTALSPSSIAECMGKERERVSPEPLALHIFFFLSISNDLDLECSTSLPPSLLCNLYSYPYTNIGIPFGTQIMLGRYVTLNYSAYIHLKSTNEDTKNPAHQWY